LQQQFHSKSVCVAHVGRPAELAEPACSAFGTTELAQTRAPPGGRSAALKLKKVMNFLNFQKINLHVKSCKWFKRAGGILQQMLINFHSRKSMRDMNSLDRWCMWQLVQQQVKSQLMVFTSMMPVHAGVC
jgi:hypothetical protein